jgi:hypothetical protein
MPDRRRRRLAPREETTKELAKRRIGRCVFGAHCLRALPDGLHPDAIRLEPGFAERNTALARAQ